MDKLYSGIKLALIIIQLLVCVMTDVECYEVKNKVVLPFAIAGVVYNIMFGGVIEVISSFGGLLLPIILLIWLHISNMLGAGDIKLICSLGALVGCRLILWSICYSFLSGLVIAVMLMLARKSFVQSLKKLFHYFKSCMLYGGIIPYTELSKESGNRMHFTIPIAIGTIAAYIVQI